MVAIVANITLAKVHMSGPPHQILRWHYASGDMMRDISAWALRTLCFRGLIIPKPLDRLRTKSPRRDCRSDLGVLQVPTTGCGHRALFRQTGLAPSVGKIREDVRIHTHNYGEAPNSEARVEPQNGLCRGFCLLMSTQPNQRCRQISIRNAEIRIQLYRVSCRGIGFLIAL